MWRLPRRAALTWCASSVSSASPFPRMATPREPARPIARLPVPLRHGFRRTSSGACRALRSLHQPVTAVAKRLDARRAPRPAGANQSAADQRQGFVDELQRPGVLPAAVLVVLRQLDIGQNAAPSWFGQQPLPPGGGFVVATQRPAAPRCALHRLEALCPAKSALECRFEVRERRFVVALVLRCPGGVQRMPLTFDDRREVCS